MKYRKKPIVIDAEVYRRGLEDGIECAIQGCQLFHTNCNDCPLNTTTPYIETTLCKVYIITGVKGERYPCKPDIFDMTYDKVES